jgi:hypothetical protein
VGDARPYLKALPKSLPVVRENSIGSTTYSMFLEYYSEFVPVEF